IAYPGGISDNRGSASELELSVKQGSIHASMDESCDFQLIDLTGKVIQSIPSTNNAEFNTNQLPKGIYIIQARNGEVNTATKVWRW
ncbi:MAG: T9SS type A sorting domain-containing protein, partial [Salibacteraceae bacterium]|nr:T9SS type A sorting domain-containing protein [Salibacteraceae bacterium]MDP4762764.1 T9SS type A sorting domain-containing protein [Salibacteraceae bacterium]